MLGTYHMANPGRDLFNMQADDVLAPKRQQEIAELLAVLKRFNPTRIAIETNPGGRRDKEYADYLAGSFTLSHNEIDQIGYRLGKELGHQKIFAVDVDGEFPFQHVVTWAKANGRSKQLDSLMAEIGTMVKAQNAYLSTHTILETLLYMNADEKVAQDIGYYFRQAAYGEPWDWAGADFLTEWFRRNMRIYSNIVGLVESPSERILVIYGAGHLGWLRHAIASNPKLRLRKLAEFTKTP